MKPVTTAELRATATVGLMTAAAVLGIGRTKAYELATRDQFPCRVIRVGQIYRVPTPGLLELLGLAPEQPATTIPPPTTTSQLTTTSTRYDTRPRTTR